MFCSCERMFAHEALTCMLRLARCSRLMYVKGADDVVLGLLSGTDDQGATTAAVRVWVPATAVFGVVCARAR